ncbi:sulfite exporter TauE/SafE family protein [Candidatus Xianfuyuplasma coldseepsis]|uniref:Probable membrane transporter protein n=1 Tax=Candidatus Xianfuyuplasma coldseepsis TaxID=2782163 RepID=A0A7L7KS23_9MOLU|nr:sulfite exporter TauE/SafE family protein [Xianfuyuplasma coldseepsis]QMS85219.1 sulfite exporter TauE/SafE family protein [Xianfuyuplasma coldseepsis]
MDTWLYVSLIALTAGFVKGVSGFGSSLVSIPLLALVFGVDYIKEIVVVMVTFNLILNSMLLVAHKGFRIDSLRNVWLIPLFGILFTIVGIEIFIAVSDTTIKTIAGIMILVSMGIKILQYSPYSITLPETNLFKIIVGSLSGIGNGIASIDGPPVVFYLSSIHAEKVYFKNVLAAHFLVMGIAAVFYHISIGSYTMDIVSILLVMIVGTAIGAFVGIKISKNWQQHIFDYVVIVILFALGMYFLLW